MSAASQFTSKAAELLKHKGPEIASLLILVSLLITAVCGVKYRQQTEWIQHTLEVKNEISNLFSSVQDAETGQRGFLLSADPAFLEPYSDASALVKTQLANVRLLTADNAAQQKNVAKLAPLVGKRLADLAARIKQFHLGEKPTLDELREGKVGMDKIRDVIAQMRKTEDELLAYRNERADRFINFATALALATAMLAIAAITGWTWRTRKLTSDLEQSNRSLTATITERDLAESKARQLQKLESIGQLTGGIAHDFNNILAVIIAGLSLSQRRAKTLAEAQPFIQGALESAHRGAELTRRLLAFARQQPLEPRTISVNRLISDISELLTRAVGETIQTETVLAGGIWSVSVDPNQLQNAVLNLAVNARDAMPEGGKLTIETANCHLDDRYARENEGAKAGQYVLVGVTDTGTGMEPDIAGKAFEPFFTTKLAGKGTGLGLSQVHGFVKQSNGHIKIYTEHGKGTTVKMYFPRYTASAEEEVKREISELDLPQGEPSIVLLVVEDDPRVRNVSVSLLRNLGYSVVHAEGATTALAKLDEIPGINLLFTDIVMPEVDGRRLADAARKRKPDLKVLFTTGFTKNAVIHGGILDGGVNLLSKPFTIEQLARKVHEVLKA